MASSCVLLGAVESARTPGDPVAEGPYKRMLPTMSYPPQPVQLLPMASLMESVMSRLVFLFFLLMHLCGEAWVKQRIELRGKYTSRWLRLYAGCI